MGGVIRSDVMTYRKGIHVALERSTHAGLRAVLFKYELSMQELFNEFATQLVAEDRSALLIAERLAKRKLEAQIETLKRQKVPEKFDDLDGDTLYHLIQKNEDF